MLRLILCFFLLASLVTCRKNDELTTISIPVTDFTAIELNSSYEVILIQSDTCRLTIEAPSRLIGKVHAEVVDHNLRIETKAKMAWTRPKHNNIKLFIEVQDLQLIKANETCRITSSNTLTGDGLGVVFASKLNEADLRLNYTTFFYWNNFPCGGKLKLSGACTYLKLWNYALMQVDASQLTAENALIENSSKGDCSAFVNQTLTYAIKGEGDIHLFCNAGNVPVINQTELSGKGRIFINE